MPRIDIWELYQLIRRLRAPDGCPWDRAQTLQSLKEAVAQEGYEVLEAIERGQGLSEELGDVLLVVLLLVAIAEEEGLFTLEEVLEGLKGKVIERHPHVFGDRKVSSEGEVLKNWEKFKKKPFPDNVNTAQPATLLADEIGRKASRLGFDWPGPREVLEKVKEELGELSEALERGDKAAAREELGDLFFAAAMLARHLGTSSEEALRRACLKFIERFRRLRDAAEREGRSLEEMSLREMDELWEKLK